jgi:hypothetical protein
MKCGRVPNNLDSKTLECMANRRQTFLLSMMEMERRVIHTGDGAYSSLRVREVRQWQVNCLPLSEGQCGRISSLILLAVDRSSILLPSILINTCGFVEPQPVLWPAEPRISGSESDRIANQGRLRSNYYQ